MLDIAWEDDFAAQTQKMCDDAGAVTYVVEREVGSAAGWPEVRFDGSYDDLMRLIAAYTLNDDDTEIYRELIEE